MAKQRLNDWTLCENRRKLQICEGQVRWIRSCGAALNRLCIRALLVNTFGPNTKGVGTARFALQTGHTCTRVSHSLCLYMRTHACAQVSHFCNATYKHNTGIFLSPEDTGETEDVGGLHEGAADDGRPQWPLRDPNACSRESCGGRCQGYDRRTGKMSPPTA